MRLCGTHGPLDQFQRGLPVHAHATLGRVHRFGESEPLVPEVLPEGQRRVPVDRGTRIPGVPLAQRVRNHMGRRKSGAGQRHLGRAGQERRAGKPVGFQPAVGGGKIEHRAPQQERSKTRIPSRPPWAAATRAAPTRRWSGCDW